MDKEYKSNSSFVEYYTKIQEAVPSHLSTLPHKEVGYYVHVELDRLYKLKNCVDALRSNSELYKKFSKKFSFNFQNNVNQLVACCGLEQQARIESSIGFKKNPGIFMIMGISLLDQKYQHDHKNFDVQISFVESREGKFYDLLTYTKEPLKMTIDSEKVYHFNESYFKITTFAQFLKLFKIALFNNKQRDFKTNQSFRPKIKSSFIMSIITRSYTNGKAKEQKTTLIDFSMQQLEFGQKSQWQYFMIELNNLTNRKKQHYHLVEPNPLINLITQYLKSGQTYIVHSIAANPETFPQNYEFIQEIQGLVTQINPRNHDCIPPEIPNNEQILKKQIFGLSNKIMEGIISQKYQSLREYRENKQKILDVFDIIKKWNSATTKILMKILQNKRKISIVEHSYISDQLRLIGSCVKTDHYKDFYQAKSYLSLQRQILIKSQNGIKSILELNKQKKLLSDKFMESRYKQTEYLQTINCNGIIQGKIQGSCTTVTLQYIQMKKSEPNITYKLLRKVLQYYLYLFNWVCFFSMRTSADEILREESINLWMEEITQDINDKQQQLSQLARNGKVNFQLEEGAKDTHLTMLIREIRTLIKNDQSLKNKRANLKANISKSKKEQKQNCIGSVGIGENGSKTKFKKLPMIQKTSYCLTGQLNLKDMLMNPQS